MHNIFVNTKFKHDKTQKYSKLSHPVRKRSLTELVGPVRFILSTEFITSARKVSFCVKMFTFKVPFIRFHRQ